MFTLNLVTSAPTRSITPAESSPGIYGKLGRRLYVPDRIYVSTGLTPAACTRINT
jgi:hypothetical protein